MRIIGIHGREESGKDTVAGVLYHAHSAARVAFANPVKEMLMVLLQPYGITRSTLDQREVKERVIPDLGKSPRELMRSLGTEWGRKLVHVDIWCKHLEDKIQYYGRFTKVLIVTDVRYDNEANVIRRRGGEIWHIERRLADSRPVQHDSEAGIEIHAGVDSLLINEGTPEDLADEVEAAFNGLRKIPQARTATA